MKYIASFLLLAAPAAHAVLPFTWGNILVSNRATREILEYTRTGDFVQKVEVPWVQGQTSVDYIRDFVVDSYGNLHVFNGLRAVAISSLDVTTGEWTHLFVQGLTSYNVNNSVKVAMYGDYLFVTDHMTPAGPENGVVRIDVRDGTWVRFAPMPYNDDPIALTVAPDSNLYVLNGAGSPSGRFLQVFDPLSLDLLQHVVIPSNVRRYAYATNSLAVDAQGNYYLAQTNGPIYKVSRELELVDAFYFTRTAAVQDMNVSSDGQVLVTQKDGRVVILAPDYSELCTFDATSSSDSWSFGAFIEPPVPEPNAAVGLAGAGLLLVLKLRRRR